MKINPEFKKVAIQAAEEAGKVLKKNFRKRKRVWQKAGRVIEFVTDADVLSEETIRKIIKGNFPDHDILGEEKGGNIGKGFTWVVDPLDGTSNYIIGLPLFSVCLCLLAKEKPILSVIFNPLLHELYFAEKGKGAFLNGEKINVNQISNLSQSLLGFNKGKDLVGGLKILTKIAPFLRTTRFCGGSIELCKTAAGKIEGFIASKPQYYDMAAGAFLVVEAGGKATDFKGKEYNLDSRNIIVTNRRIHKKILELIKD